MSSMPEARVAELPDPEHDPGRVRDLAEEILSDPKYDEPSPSLLERVFEWIGERLADLLTSIGLPGGGGTAGWLAWALLIVLIGVAVALLAWAIASGVFGRRARGRPEEDPAIVLTEEGRTVAGWLAVAEEHEAAGRWSEGLLCRYRALVVDLCDRGVIAEVAGRTAGEYVREVASSPQAERSPLMADRFAQATDLFEEAWYGGAHAGPAERDRFTDLVGVASGDRGGRL